MAAVTDYEAKTVFAELRREEDALTMADADVSEAVARYRIAESRYVAIRELARSRFGRSPYSMEIIQDYAGAEGEMIITGEHPTFGIFRFRSLKMGDAVVEYLQESGGEQTLEQIFKALREGGMLHINPRAVNGALMNTGGVVRTRGEDYVHYSYEPDAGPDPEGQ